jgi:hypothetical protein
MITKQEVSYNFISDAERQFNNLVIQGILTSNDYYDYMIGYHNN